MRDAMSEDNQTQSTFQAPPKGVGISPKLFMMVIVTLTVLFLFVMVMVINYRGKHESFHTDDPNTLVANQNGISPEAAINQLNQNEKNGLLISSTLQQKNPTNSDIQQMNKSSSTIPVYNHEQLQQLQQAASSVISVMNNYHGPMSAPVLANDANTNNQDNIMMNTRELAQLSNGNLSEERRNGNYQSQNMQQEKTAFLQAARQNKNHFYLSSTLQKPISPYEVKAGTIIPATLITGIDSDLPGQITAQVSQNIYDTVTGNYLLIPQGTRVLGVYDSKVSYGQKRVLIVWSRLIFPSGNSFDLQGQPGVDLMGMSGLYDQVDNHYTKIFGSALMFSVFGALGQLSQPQQANGVLTNQQIIYGAIGQQMSQTGAQLVEKNMNIQPTITIRPGANFNILLTRDMVLPAPYRTHISYHSHSQQYFK